MYDVGSIVSAAALLHEDNSSDNYHEYTIDKQVHKIPKIDKSNHYSEFMKSLLKK